MSSIFPYFGSKEKISRLIFEYSSNILGEPPKQIVDPFCGSLGTWLDWPNQPIFKINDANGYIVNFWRAVKHAPNEIANAIGYPYSIVDLSAQNEAMIRDEANLLASLRADPDYYSLRHAVAFVRYSCCSVMFGGFRAKASFRQRPTGLCGVDCNPHDTMRKTSKLLEKAMIFCTEDFSSVVSPAQTCWLGATLIFLDPPYDNADYCYDSSNTAKGKNKRDVKKAKKAKLEGQALDDTTQGKNPSIATQVLDWCIKFNDDPKRKKNYSGGKTNTVVALCCYSNDNAKVLLDHGWHQMNWHQSLGFFGANRGKDNKETIYWSSPLVSTQASLF